MGMDREAQKFWRDRRREMLRRDRSTRRGQGTPVTFVIIGLLVVGWGIQNFFPGWIFDVSVYGGRIGFIVLSTILPGSLLGLLLDGLFVWLIGSELEQVLKPWQYVAVFFGSGIIGATVMTVMGAGAAALSVFGLAGAYVYVMARYNYQGAVRWALLLLLINVVLSGFHPSVLVGMVSTFGVGLGIAWSMGAG
ncbi:hypothetical protein [Sulfobacillus sp. hq2]|nr:hypothetical protein [Sulfobacillus sp. hq2]